MKSKTILASALALTIAGTSFIFPSAHTNHVSAETIQTTASTSYKKVFSDVTKKNVNYDIIHEMAAQGIIRGYSEDNTFRGGNSITRYQAASLIYRYFGDKLVLSSKNVKLPTDISAKSSHYKAMVALIKAGLLEPNSKGKINPSKPITRAEMAKILTVAFELDVKANYDFIDTTKDAVLQQYVRALYSNGVTTGYMQDGTFRPDASLTRQQFAVFMYRAIHLDENFVAEPIPQTYTPDEKEDDSTTVVEDDTTVVEDEVIVSPPTTNGYDRYAINNELTPLSELEGMSTDSNVFKGLDGNKLDFKKMGMTYSQWRTYSDTLFEQYKRHITISDQITLGSRLVDTPELLFTAPTFLKDFDHSRERAIQAFHYVMTTGAVYKGKTIVIKYVTDSKGESSNIYIGRNNR